jgi:hypothetical protein
VGLTGAQFATLQSALGSAFPSPGMLRQMLRVRMDVTLDLVAGGSNYGEVLFNVITWAESEGRVDELLEQALADKPGNPDLKRFVEQFQAEAAKTPPGVVDLSSWVTIHDSGAEGTVAAMSTVTAMETSLARRGDPQLLSTRWLYWKAKQHDELHGGEGTFLTTVIYCAEQFGVPLESVWPYVPGDKGEPPKGADSATYSLHSFRVDSFDGIPEQLGVGRPVVVAVNVYSESWFDDKVSATGRIPSPPPNPRLAGGHALTIVGYNPEAGEFRFANDWGTSWGDAGFGTMHRKSATAHVNVEQMWGIEVPPATADR